MPLYIRDDLVDTLAARLQAVTGARTKTDAVRAALEHDLARHAEPAPSQDAKIERILQMVRAANPVRGAGEDRTAFLYDDDGLPR